MENSSTALLLIGYQFDYFNSDGILHEFIESSSEAVLKSTLSLLEQLDETDVTIIDLPIAFTENYSELSENASGILGFIKEKGAFQAGKAGSDVIPEIEQFRGRLNQMPGKRGLDSFANTGLHNLLRSKDIKNIALAGAVTSVCIDSTGRSGVEKGYNITVLNDCTSARTEVEQNMYCEHIFPIYANVMGANEWLGQLH